MKMLRRTAYLAWIAFVLSVLTSTGAMATAQRTFVASFGSPANTAFNCSITKPCRAFGDAIGVTNAGGEVIVLDSAGYGSVIISHSVSIVAPSGVYAGISVFTGDGVIIAAGTGDKVTLRGLTINGQGGNSGIVVTSGGDVNIEHCIIANMGSDGIQIDGGTFIHIRNSIARSNFQSGLRIASGVPEVYIVDAQFTNNLAGIAMSVGKLDATRSRILTDEAIAQPPRNRAQGSDEEARSATKARRAVLEREIR